MKATYSIIAVVLSLTFVNVSCAQQPKSKDGKKPPSYAQLLKDMDANKDGKLAKLEVKGPLKDQFETVDANADGFISEEEFKNAPKPEGRKSRK